MNAFKRFICLTSKISTIILICILTSCAPSNKFISSQISQPVDTQSLSHEKINDQKSSQLTTSEKIIAIKPSHSKSENIPQAWKLSGAIAARSKTRSWTASINWLQQSKNTYQIRLSGPLGNGSVLIEKQGAYTYYRDGAKVTRKSNAEALLHQQTGIRLPVNNLYYWVRGLPAPGGSKSTQDSTHHLQVLHQAGFMIEYLKYTKFNNSWLPALIKLQGNGIIIKLVIKNWGLA